jgi:ATP-binding cassette, subfamily B, bacterial PglK
LITIFNKISSLTDGGLKGSVGIFILVLFSLILEIFGLSLVAPIIGIILEPQRILNSISGNEFVSRININHTNVSYIIIITFAIALVLKTIISVILQYKIVKYSLSQQVLLRLKLFKKYQSLDYQEYTKENSSKYIYNLSTLIPHFTTHVLINGMKVLGELLISIAIVIFLIFVNYKLFLFLLILLLSFVFFYDFLLRNKIKLYGRLTNEYSDNIIRNINESFAGFKSIRVFNLKDYFIRKLHQDSILHGKYFSTGIILSNLPRYFLELILFLFLIVSILILSSNGMQSVNMLSSIGVFAVSSIRLIPAFNLISSFTVNFRFSRDCILRLSDILEKVSSSQQNPNTISIKNFEFLNLSNVSFNYEDSNGNILDSLNLNLNNGDKIGIIGKSGSGKSTLIDIILGLLAPSSGVYKVNNMNFTQCNLDYFAYIPQEIFLVDDNILANIALGIDHDKIDMCKVKSCAKMASLDIFIDELEQGYYTQVGQDGVKLSGGQKQRIIIARALYHNKKVIILDEATSALDSETEDDVITELINSDINLTFIFVTHRTSVLRGCNRIYKLVNGKLSQQKVS